MSSFLQHVCVLFQSPTRTYNIRYLVIPGNIRDSLGPIDLIDIAFSAQSDVLRTSLTDQTHHLRIMQMLLYLLYSVLVHGNPTDW